MDLNVKFGIKEFKDVEAIQKWMRDQMARLESTNLMHIRNAAKAMSRDINRIFDGKYLGLSQWNKPLYLVSQSPFWKTFREAMPIIQEMSDGEMDQLKAAEILGEQIIEKYFCLELLSCHEISPGQS